MKKQPKKILDLLSSPMKALKSAASDTLSSNVACALLPLDCTPNAILSIPRDMKPPSSRCTLSGWQLFNLEQKACLCGEVTVQPGVRLQPSR